MKTYKLYKTITGEISNFAHEIIDGNETGVNVNIHTNQEYLAWVEQGNEPLPADEVK